MHDKKSHCAICESLTEYVELPTPERLLELAAHVAIYVEYGKLKQVGRTMYDLKRGRIRDGLVVQVFRCAACGTHYELAAETNRVTGGSWRQRRTELASAANSILKQPLLS